MDSIPSPCPKCGGPRYYQGKRPRCKACRNAAKRQYNQAYPEKNRARANRWAEANRERARTRSAEWRASHIEEVRATDRERSTIYRKNNPEKRSDSNRRWSQANPDKRLATRHRRRSRMRGNGGHFTAQEWRDLKAQYDHRCLCCGKQEPEIKLTVDHVVPVLQGGTSDISNIQPLCLFCNDSKGHWRATDYRPSWPRQLVQTALDW